MEYEQGFHFSEVIRTLREKDWKIQSLEPLSHNNRDSVALQFVMHGTKKTCKDPEEVLEIIRKMDQVWFIEEL